MIANNQLVNDSLINHLTDLFVLPVYWNSELSCRDNAVSCSCFSFVV